MHRWRTTILVIRLALWPQKNGGTEFHPPDAARTTAPLALRARLSNLAAYLDRHGHLQFKICDCFALAAPFILFRLKRTGFSDCRVTHKNGELTISARR
jgi:hypothetical protein